MTTDSRIDATRSALLADGVIVAIRCDDAATAERAARAALAGGLRVLEITPTTPGALELIARLAGEGVALVGAGTVLGPADVTAVAAAGARYALSPVFGADVADAARAAGLLYVPGAATPLEMLTAHRAGCALVKFFPSGALGGPAFLRAVRGPLPEIGLIPTSGPDSTNIGDFVAAGARAVGVGPELFGPGWTPESVTAAARRTREAMDAARAAR